MVVTVPEVPSRCIRSPAGQSLRGDERRQMPGDFRHHRLVDLARHFMPAVALGQRHHADRHRRPALISGGGGPRRHGANGRAAPARRSRRRCRTGSRLRHRDRAAACSRSPRARASVSRSMISSSSPTSSRCERWNSPPLTAVRQASVAIRRARVTPRFFILSRQMPSASIARAIAASLMRPDAEMPSPSRMMRENASMTRNASPVGRATRRRQLLVPRSSAA